MALNIETRFDGPTAIKEPFPTGFVNPVFTISFAGTPVTEGVNFDIAEGAIPNVDSAVGLEALRVAIEAEVTTNQIPNVLGLDVAGNTVDMTVLVTSSLSVNDRASSFNVSSLVYRTFVLISYEIS